MVEYEDLIYNYVRLIPLGMVTTFHEVAKAVGNGVQVSNVVNALKKIQDVDYIPAHRVVTSDGCFSSSFVDGGKRGQKKRLISEGIIIRKNNNKNFSR